MADVNANINIEIDSSDAVASLKNLQNRITEFNNSVIRSNASAVAAQKSLLSTLSAQIGAAGQFSTSMVNVESSVNRLGTAIDKNKLSLGEYFKYGVASTKTFGRVFAQEHNSIMDLAADRVKRLQTQYVALEKSQSGMTKAMAVRPMSLFNADAAISIQRQQLFNKLLHDGSTSLINFGKNTQWAGRQLMVGFSVPLAAFGMVASKTFMDLDKQARDFKRVYGDAFTPPEEIQKNLDAVQNLGKEYTKYGISLKDTMTVAATAAAAGMKNEKLTGNTEQALRLATVGQIDYQQALTTTITLQNAFKISNQELAPTVDFIGAVANQTVLTVDDLTNAIPRVAPVIQGLGGDVKDLAVMLVAMKEGGVSAEQGANALKSGLASLINPTKSAAKAAGEYGINIQGIVKANKGDLMGTVQAFGAALGKLDSFGRQQVLEKVFGKYQFARIGALFDNINEKTGQVKQSMDLLGMSTQDLAAMSDKSLNQIAESTTAKFQSAVEQLKIAIAPIGEIFLKVATPVINFATKLLDKFNELSPGVKQFITILTIGLGVIVPAAIMLVGLFANFAGNVIKGLSLVNTFFNRIKSGGSIFKYMSGEELDAAAAATSLEGSTNKLTSSLNTQREAVMLLAGSYKSYVGAANAAAASLPQGFRSPSRKMATGGFVGGTGNKDSEPTLLMPGEFVVNKKAAQENGPILAAMNAGTIKKLSKGSESDNTTLKYTEGKIQAGHIGGEIPFNEGIAAVKKNMDLMVPSAERTIAFFEHFKNDLGDSTRILGNLTVMMNEHFNRDLANAGVLFEDFSHTWKGTLSVEQRWSDALRLMGPEFEVTTQQLQLMEDQLLLNTEAAAKARHAEELRLGLIEKGSIVTVKDTDVLAGWIRTMESADPQIRNLTKDLDKLRMLPSSIRSSLSAESVVSTGAQRFTTQKGNERFKLQDPFGTVRTLRMGNNETTNLLASQKRYGLTSFRDAILSSNPSQAITMAKTAGEKVGGVFKKAFVTSTETNGKSIASESMKNGHHSAVPEASLYAEMDGKKYGERFVQSAVETIKKRGRQNPIPANGIFSVGSSGEVQGRKPLALGSSSTTNFLGMPKMPKVVGDLPKESKGLVEKMKGMSGKLLGASAGLTTLSMGLSFMDNGIGQIAQQIMPFTFVLDGVTAAMTMFEGVTLASVASFAAIALPVAGLIAAIYFLKKNTDDQIAAGEKLANAQTLAAGEISGVAAAYGRNLKTVKNQDTAFKKLTGLTSPQMDQARNFISTNDVGKNMVSESKQSLETSSREFVRKLSSDLSTLVITGAIGPKQAQALAGAISTELGRSDLSASVVGNMTQLIGPDGKDILTNPITVYANIVASNTQDANSIFNDMQTALSNISGEGFLSSQLTNNGVGEFYNKALEKTVAYQTAISTQLQAQKDINDGINVSAQQRIDYLKKRIAGETDSNKKQQLNLQLTEAEKQKADLLIAQEKQRNDLRNKAIATTQSPEMTQGGYYTKLGSATIGAQEQRISNATGINAKSLIDQASQKLGASAVLQGGPGGEMQYNPKITATLRVDLENGAIDAQQLQKLLDSKTGQKTSKLVLDLEQSGDVAGAQQTLNAWSGLSEENQKLFELKVQQTGVTPAQLIAYAGILQSIESMPPDIKKNILNTLGGATPDEMTHMYELLNSISMLPPTVNKDINVENKGLSATTLKRISDQYDLLNGKDNIKKQAEVVFGTVDPKQQAKYLKDLGLTLDQFAAKDSIFKMAVTAVMTATPPPEIANDPVALGKWRDKMLAVTGASFETPQNTTTPPVNPTGSGSKSWLKQTQDDIKANLKLENMLPKIAGNAGLKGKGLLPQLLEKIGVGEEGLKNAQSLLKLSKNKLKEFIRSFNQDILNQSIKSIGTDINKQQQQNNMTGILQSKGFKPRDAASFASQYGDQLSAAAALGQKSLNGLIGKLKELYREQQNSPEQTMQNQIDALSKVHDRETRAIDENIYQLQKRIDSYNEEIDLISKLVDVDQSRIDNLNAEKEAIQRQIDAKEHDNGLDQRKIDTLQRQSDLRSRVSDKISHDLDLMSQQETQIKDQYQQRIDALTKISQINDHIANQQKSQLDVAKAFSEGDIYAAAQAANQMSQDNAQYAQQQQQAALQQGMNNAVNGLRTEGGLTKQQAEAQINAIKEQNYQTSLQIRDIEDAIYQRNLDIIPLKDQQYTIDQNIQKIQDDINAKQASIKAIQESQIAPLTEQVTAQEKIRAEINKTYDDTTNNIKQAYENGLTVNQVADAVDNVRLSWNSVTDAILQANKAAKEGLTSLKEPKVGKYISNGVLDKKAYDAAMAAYEAEVAKIQATRNTAVNNAISTGVATQATAGMYMGGMVKYANGGHVGMDSVPALLTPGEFVMRNAAVKKYGANMLSSMNMGALDMPRYNLNSGQMSMPVQSGSNVSNISAPVYNTYSVHVPVNQPGASADEIANKVIMKIKHIEGAAVRGNRGY